MYETLVAAKVPLPRLMTYFVSAVEFGGGCLLILGLLSSLVSLALLADMLVAILTTKLSAMPKATFASQLAGRFPLSSGSALRAVLCVADVFRPGEIQRGLPDRSQTVEMSRSVARPNGVEGSAFFLPPGRGAKEAVTKPRSPLRGSAQFPPCPAGHILYTLDRGHTLQSRSGFLVLKTYLVVEVRWKCGNRAAISKVVGSPAFGLSTTVISTAGWLLNSPAPLFRWLAGAPPVSGSCRSAPAETGQSTPDNSDRRAAAGPPLRPSAPR